ncbi:50S ribosomal protein L18 [Linum grandiflorum]
MTALSLRRATRLLSRVCFHFQLKSSNFCSKASATTNCADGWTREAPTRPNRYSSISLSPLFRDPTAHLDRFDIELVDNDTWQVSSGIAHAYHGIGKNMEAETGNEASSSTDQVNTHSMSDPDFDEIDNMRIRGNLFYKLDRHSKEYQEYSYDFHRRKKKGDGDEVRGSPKKESLTMNEPPKGSKRNEDSQRKTLVVAKDGKAYALNLDGCASMEKKVRRSPTFNQLTAPYHEPFCLDIFVSNASVSASVIHRATSNVVAVAHSISKDIKMDLGSTRNEATCAAVGKILAQRALEDDIHNVVYTPRKGDRLEGKLQIVLQSVIDSGLSVKVKLKQRKLKKPSRSEAI